MSKPNTLVLYHDACTDGFGAAYAVWTALGDNAEYRPVKYDKPAPDDIDGRSIIIVDFSYPADVLRAMARRAAGALVLDHHATAQADLEGIFPSPEEATEQCRVPRVRFDMSKSGALLAWEFFVPDRPPPAVLQHIDDYDRWVFALPWTREIIAALRSHPSDFEVWDRFIADYERDASSYILEGAAILRAHDRIVDLLMVEPMMWQIGTWTVPVVNAPYMYASDTAGRLAQGHPFAATYYDTACGRVISLRRRDGTIDVGRVAKVYGGGGHPAAAGFTMPHGWRGDDSFDKVSWIKLPPSAWCC